MAEWTAFPEGDPKEIEGGEPDRSPEGMRRHALDTARSLIATAVGQVAALTDAVGCDSTEDGCWRCDLALPTFCTHSSVENCLSCPAAAHSPQERRAEGYVGLSLLHEVKGVRACGGHYDPQHRPRAIYEEDLPLNSLTHESLGQALMNIHARVIRAHVANPTEVGCHEGAPRGTLMEEVSPECGDPARLASTMMGTMEGGNG